VPIIRYVGYTNKKTQLHLTVNRFGRLI